VIFLSDVAATARVATELARVLRPGDVIALHGDLGAGKTTLVDACVRALGGDGAHSPTFALVHQYPFDGSTLGDPRPLSLWHIDLYRIDRPAKLVELGLEEIFGNRSGVAFVEWADKHDVLPRAYLELSLSHLDEGRQLAIKGHGGRGQQMAEALLEALARR
jgi:tRNA threonylcarbamoyl adenosine modification protein YjeE